LSKLDQQAEMYRKEINQYQRQISDWRSIRDKWRSIRDDDAYDDGAIDKDIAMDQRLIVETEGRLSDLNRRRTELER
jgi:hypothetical protein